MLYGRTAAGMKVRAAPKQVAYCPGCGEPLIAKCGAIKIWHWAHGRDSLCTWDTGDMCDWHLAYQMIFPAEQVEVAVNGLRADVVAHSGVVLEFQHSPIDVATIAKREAAHGAKRMIWIFDVREPWAAGRLKQSWWQGDEVSCLRWKHPRRSWASASAKALLDVGKGRLWAVSLWANKGRDIYGYWTSRQEFLLWALHGTAPRKE